MGTINVRSGHLQLDFRYRGLRCREQTRLADTPANRRKLRTLLDRIEAEIVLNSFDYARYFPNSRRAKLIADRERMRGAEFANAPRFRDFAEVWYSELEIGWRPSYRTTVRSTLDKYLIPEFGGQPVSAIRREEVLRFRANVMKRSGRNERPLSAERVNHIMSALRMILDEAGLRHGFATPLQGIKALPVPRTDVEPFNLDEVRLFLANVRPDFAHCGHSPQSDHDGVE